MLLSRTWRISFKGIVSVISNNPPFKYCHHFRSTLIVSRYKYMQINNECNKVEGARSSLVQDPILLICGFHNPLSGISSSTMLDLLGTPETFIWLKIWNVLIWLKKCISLYNFAIAVKWNKNMDILIKLHQTMLLRATL